MAAATNGELRDIITRSTSAHISELMKAEEFVDLMDDATRRLIESLIEANEHFQTNVILEQEAAKTKT